MHQPQPFKRGPKDSFGAAKILIVGLKRLFLPARLS